MLKFKAGVDLFASDFHHQLPRYYAMEDDLKPAWKDAFKANWLTEHNPYINPPWHLIPKWLKKDIEDQAEAMVVVPKWELASWWTLYHALSLRHIDLTEAIYLKPDKTLWKKPPWDTRIGIMYGSRRTREPPSCQTPHHQTNVSGKSKCNG